MTRYLLAAALAALALGAAWIRDKLQRHAIARAKAERDAALNTAADATGRAAAESTARHQRETFTATRGAITDAADRAAADHPEDPDAAGAAADRLARERWDRLHADRDPVRRDAADPVPRDATAEAARRGR